MKINNLKLKGFIGVKKGLGLDDLELDLTGLSGLIAFSGQNGSGKTSILESLQPYRTLASRKKALPFHVFTRDACKELDFDFQGDNYKTKVLIDCDSGRQEGYVWKNGSSEVDGKVRNYDAYIENLFGSRDLFFSSIFCAQNSSKLSDLTTGKLKELFAEFLRLDQYIAYENTTKQCITLLSSQGGVYARQAENFRERLARYGDLTHKLTQRQIDLTEINEAQARSAQEIAELEGKTLAAKERIAANKALTARVEDFRGRITTTEKAIQTELAAYESRVDSIRTEVRNAKHEIVKLAQILDDKDRIEQAVIRRKELTEKIEIKTDTINAELQNISDLKEQTRKQEKAIEVVLKPHIDEAKIPIFKEQIRNLKTLTADLGRRDPECSSVICGFIKTALEAEKSIPVVERLLSETREFVERHNTKIKELANQLTAEKTDIEGKVKEASKFVSGMQELLTAHKKEHAKSSELADRQGDLREAMAKKGAAEKREKDLTAQGMGIKGDYARKVEGLKVELLGLKNSLEEVTGQIDYGAQKALTILEQDIYLARNQKEEVERKISDINADIRTIQDNIKERTMLTEQLTEAETKAKTIQAQVSEWIYLRNALSKDGIRALEIDSVAPSISAYANQILFNTFGPAYSVKLRTQDDEGREVLDILAIEEDGRETLLEDLSGGEKVWSLKALRLAMTLIAKQKSGKQFLSAMADEEDGSLDAGNAQNFIHLYRAFMDTGGFEDCFFISHRPECVAMADHVLEFGEGGISIN